MVIDRARLSRGSVRWVWRMGGWEGCGDLDVCEVFWGGGVFWVGRLGGWQGCGLEILDLWVG